MNQKLEPISCGMYSYWQNGEPAGVSESWEIVQLGDGVVVTSSVRESARFGSWLRVESWAENGRISQFTLQFKSTNPNHIQEATATYKISSGYVDITRSIDGVETAETESFSGELIVSPLMRIYVGTAIQKLVAQDGAGNVLVPWIVDPANREAWFTPQIQPRSATFLCAEVIEINGRIHQTKKYEYIGGPYQPGSHFWLNKDNRLIKYIWDGGEHGVWETILNDA